MKKRVITGLIMAFILIPAVLVPACLPVLEFIVVLLIIGGEVELLRMFSKEKKLPIWIYFLGVALTLGMSFSIFAFMAHPSDPNSGEAVFTIENSLILHALFKLNLTKIFTPVTSLLIDFIVLMSLMIFDKDIDVKDVGALFMSIIYVGVCSAAFLTLRFYGVRFVVYLLCITICTDIFALVFGLTLGRRNGGKHKMAPHISPKKTWEGGIGGTCVAVVVGFAISYFYSFISPFFHDGAEINFFDGIFNYSSFTGAGKVFFCLILSFFLSVCSQVGDLVASKLKRAYGIKDYSNIFPGHGGVLDRFDSIFFASAMFLLFLICEQNLFVPLGEQIAIVLGLGGK